MKKDLVELSCIMNELSIELDVGKLHTVQLSITFYICHCSNIADSC